MKIFLFLALAAILFIGAKQFFAILVGSYLGNIPMKFESHWPKGLGGVSFSSKLFTIFYFSSGGRFVHRRKTFLAILVEDHLSNISMKYK